MPTPEQQARTTIDQLLTDAGWQVQDRAALNLSAARGVAVREFPLQTGFADRQSPPSLPLEHVEINVADNCYHSIDNLCRGMLKYYDARLVGLTATPRQAERRFPQPQLL
jgi:type I site-specific restriction endonuclease